MRKITNGINAERNNCNWIISRAFAIQQTMIVRVCLWTKLSENNAAKQSVCAYGQSNGIGKQANKFDEKI